VGYIPIAIWHKSEQQHSCGRALDIGHVCMVATPGPGRALQRGRIAVAQQLVLGRLPMRRRSWWPSARWIIGVLTVILACGGGLHWVALGLIFGDGSSNDGGPSPGGSRNAESIATAAGRESTTEGLNHEL